MCRFYAYKQVNSARKCIDCACKLDIAGLRKCRNWHNRLNRLMRAVGNPGRRPDKGKLQRVTKAAQAYSKKARALQVKVHSVLTTHTELIKKRKSNPNVEIGKNLAITTDQHHLIVDWQITQR